MPEEPQSQSNDDANSGASETHVEQKPDFVPDQYWDAESGSANYQQMAADLVALKADAEIARQAKEGLPQKAEDVKLSLPEGFEMPSGFEFTVPEGENATALQEWAVRNGVSQAEVSALMGLYASETLKEFKTHQANVAEFKKIVGSEPSDALKTLVGPLVGAGVTQVGLQELFASITSVHGFHALKTLADAASGKTTTSELPKSDSAEKEKLRNLSPNDKMRTLMFKNGAI